MILDEIFRLIDSHDVKLSPFKIVEIQLGKEPMALLKNEFSELGLNWNLENLTVRDIPIVRHDSFDGFVYSLSLSYAKKAYENFLKENTSQYPPVFYRGNIL